MRSDISLKEFDKTGLVWLTLLEIKTTQKGETPRLVLKGCAAQALVAWTDAAEITEGPLFRRITRTGALGRLSDAAVSQIVKRLLAEAGLDPSFASPHGLRSGFLTQAALDGTPCPPPCASPCIDLRHRRRNTTMMWMWRRTRLAICWVSEGNSPPVHRRKDQSTAMVTGTKLSERLEVTQGRLLTRAD